MRLKIAFVLVGLKLLSKYEWSETRINIRAILQQW
jgi:hypothetical protein